MTNEIILQKFEAQKSTHFTYSVILDLMGMLSFALPLLGEVTDGIFAFFYGIAIYSMYRMRLGKARAATGGLIGTIEELLPFTDFIPTATLMWVYSYKFRRQSTLKRFTTEFRDDNIIIDEIMDNQSGSQQGLISRAIASFRNLLGFGNHSNEAVYDDYVELPEEGTQELETGGSCDNSNYV